ncbi:MAG TPA: S41 family peptidase [Rhizomicrobium sp.]|nr:S41 family peptidase [Rhizomicrobium sp.]
MKQGPWAGVGAVLGLGAALAVAAAHGASDASSYGQIRLFSDAFSKVRANYVDPVEDKDLIKGAVQGMVSGLDPHSAYMDAKAFGGEFQVRTQGRFGGVGIQVTPDSGVIRVVSPMDGMPAAAAGVKPGDRITAINGTAVAGQDFNATIDRMRGPVGTKVTLTVQRDGEAKPFDVTLVRADVPIDATTSRREGDVGYIRMPGFNEKTAEGLEKAVRDLRKQIGPGLKGYVLDLRNNPGGLLDQAIQVSDDFLNSGEVVSTRGRRAEDTQRYDAKRGDITDGKPIVVLINGGTASASEIVSGALQDHKRATILGMTSFGKGSVQTVLALGEGRGALRLTTARYYTPSGHSIQAQGIIPDIQVAQGDEASPQILRYSEAVLQGHLAGEPVAAKRANAPVILAAPGTKYDDFQLAYALDLLRGTMTVASVTKKPAG